MNDIYDLVCRNCGAPAMMITTSTSISCGATLPDVPDVTCIMQPHTSEILHFGFISDTEYRW